MKQFTIIFTLIVGVLYSQSQDFIELDPLQEFPVSTVKLNIGKYGLDTLQCEENLTIYNEFYKQKSYESALKAWFYLFINSPMRIKNIYIHGATMYKSFIKNETDSVKREILIDNLLKIYDQRNMYYPGQEGKVLGLKGSDLYKYRKGDLNSLQQAYNILRESFNIDQENTQARALNYYFLSAVKLYGKTDKKKLIALFSDLSNIVEYKEAQINQSNFDLTEKKELTSKESKILKKNISDLKTLNNVRVNMEKTLAPHVTCEKLEALYEPNFELNKTNLEWLQRAADLLKKKECFDADIYYKVTAKLYESNPTTRSAFYMGYLSLKKEDYSAAIDYLSQAVEGEDDSIKKSEYLLYLAKTYAAMGQNREAKKHALLANQHRSGWGAPFILIGDLYAQTSRSCGENTGNLTNDEFTKRVGYWAAIEKYNYAKKIDSLLTEEANKKIKKYIEQAPDKTSTFQIIGLDQTEYRIECWYIELVKNPHFSN